MGKALFIFCLATSSLQIFSMIGPQRFAQVAKKRRKGTTSLYSINTTINKFILAGHRPHETPFEKLPLRLQQLIKEQEEFFYQNKRAR